MWFSPSPSAFSPACSAADARNSSVTADAFYMDSEEAKEKARLENRLEDWMRSVDMRLDKLLEASGQTDFLAPFHSQSAGVCQGGRIDEKTQATIPETLPERVHSVAQLLPERISNVEVLEKFAPASERVGQKSSATSEAGFTDKPSSSSERPAVKESKPCFEGAKEHVRGKISTKSNKSTKSNASEKSHVVETFRKVTLERVAKATSESVAEVANSILPRGTSDDVPELPPRGSVKRELTARKLVGGKLNKKWKMEMERKLGAHHLQKTTTMALRGSDMHKAFYERTDAVTKAMARSHAKCTLERLVLSDGFDYVISIVLVINAVLIGVEVQWESHGTQRPVLLEWCEWACASIFAVELVLRILGRGRDLCGQGERLWAVCDCILVSFSVVDILVAMLPGFSEKSASVADVGSSGRLLKIMRMFRILRLLRMVRFLSELRVMAHMIQHSLMSLFWLFSLLTILIYIFSIVLTQGATEFLKYDEDPVVLERYGSLFRTMYTLFQAMAGGVSWGDVTTPLMRVGMFYFAVALVYVFFSIFSVLNIVTGVFVDGAIELAKQDRSMIVTKKLQSREASAQHLVELLREMDTDGDDTLSQEEFNNSLGRKDVAEYLDALSVDAAEAELLFMLLDKDGDGTVDIEEFVGGMQRLQGEAKSFDIHLLLHANRQVLYMCSGLLDMVRRSNAVPQSASEKTRTPSSSPQRTVSPAVPSTAPQRKASAHL